MHRPPTTTASIVAAAGLTAALQLLSAACGTGASVGAAVANRVELPSGMTLQIAPGVVRERSADTPLVWASTPQTTVTVSSDDRDPPLTSFRMANLGPDSTLRVRSVEHLTSNEQPGCDADDAGTIDCSTGDDPLCSAGRFDQSDDPPTRGSLLVDLPACVKVTLALEATFEPARPLRVGIVGPTYASAPLPGLIGRLDQAGADIALLTGDHVDDSESADLERLARRLAELPLPVVVTPGERERIDGALAVFRKQLGPISLTWTMRGIQFLSFNSARQTLGDEGVSTLRRRTRDLPDDALPRAALTHTPPLDPEGLRDRGFRSRLEAARTLSVLSKEKFRLAATGHLTGPRRAQRNDLTVYIPPDAQKRAVGLLKLTPAGDESPKLKISFSQIER